MTWRHVACKRCKPAAVLLHLLSANDIKTCPPRQTSHLLQEPLQPLPRMLMGGRQQPLGSSSAVGALVPYTATSTKVGALAAAAASHESRTSRFATACTPHKVPIKAAVLVTIQGGMLF